MAGSRYGARVSAPEAVPEAVTSLLAGRPEPGRDDQAFVFLTVDAVGFPHVALLSRAELDVSPAGDAVLAVVASRRTRQNLERDGRATLVAVSGDTAHYLKLELVRSLEGSGQLGCVLRPVEHVADSLGIPLSPLGYLPTRELAELETWQQSAALLAQLAEG